MSALNRRQWIQKSLLASSAVFLSTHTELISKALEGSRDPHHPLLRLNWNENPFGPPQSAVSAVTEALQLANRYPDSKIAELKNLLAVHNGVSSREIMITAGSTEILSLLGQHVGLMQGEILTPWPTFPTLIRFGEMCGATIHKVDLNHREEIDLTALKDAITDKTKLVFVCNPNNPSATEVNTDDLKSFCKSIGDQVLICVDEAYIEYSKNAESGSMVSLVKDLPNLVVCRTFSKVYGLAGLRIGYAISQKANIEALKKRHLGFEISAGIAPVTAAMAALADSSFLESCLAKNQEGRNLVFQAFDSWGVNYNSSSTNFVYARSDRFVENVVAKLKEEKVLITQWPDIMSGHIRVSIGKKEEMQQFVSSIEKYLV